MHKETYKERLFLMNLSNKEDKLISKIILKLPRPVRKPLDSGDFCWCFLLLASVFAGTSPTKQQCQRVLRISSKHDVRMARQYRLKLQDG